MKPGSSKPKCTNVEECQALAERKQAEEDAVQKGPPPKSTKAGTRYIDMEDGNASKGTVKDGDEVTLYYKVLKLGKRSYDGLSGEGTVVFSRGTYVMNERIATCDAFSHIKLFQDMVWKMTKRRPEASRSRRQLVRLIILQL
jgi:hypothetical protein